MVSASVVFNVNGHLICPATSAVGDGAKNEAIDDVHSSSALTLFVPREEELFPTLTLHSSQTEVLCRFCAEDILTTNRESIGAPRGHVVFSVDGSVILDKRTDYLYTNTDESNLNSSSSLQSLHSMEDDL